MLGKERCGHAHDRQRRHLCNGSTNLFKHDCYLGETETSAAVGFGHTDSDNAEIGKFTPEHKVDATGIFDLFEVLHCATVGENPIGKSAKLFLI